MSATDILEQIRSLPKLEQRELIDRIWEEYGDDDLTPEEIAELDRRSKEAREHPERCIPFDEVFAEIEKKFGFKK